MDSPQSLGAVVFWGFTVPIIEEIRQKVGCQYLFLFAADLSKGEKYVKKYSDQLNFVVPTDLATAKPIYDFSCKFMCQEVKRLSNGREEFFKNMSVDEV